jgi:signal transduction histidine kinase
MPSAKFSKAITYILNSGEIDRDLKHDIACRLIGESLQVASVSMLMYDAVEDKICCKGSYLAPKAISKFSCPNQILDDIIENISVYEYFDSDVLLGGYSHELKYFQESLFSTNPSFVTQDLFEKCASNWKAEKYRLCYKSYRKACDAETYAIDRTTISGSYFRDLTLRDEFVSDICMKCMVEGPQDEKKYFEVWDSLEISLPKTRVYFVGIPLFANGRYVGILRMTVVEGENGKFDDLYKFVRENGFGKDKKSLNELAERLQNFAQLTSLHLKSNYYIEGYRKLGNIKISEGYLAVNEVELSPDINDICNILATTINCHGIVMRITNDVERISNPPIRGLSSSVDVYLNYIQNAENGEFSNDIANLFTKNDKRAIKAISFALNETSSNNFKIHEYWYDTYPAKDGEAELKLRQALAPDPAIFSDFTPEYIEFLTQSKMSRFVVVPLEFVKAGYIIMINTLNRTFTLSDIEMVLLASKRIGSEVKLLNNISEVKQSEKMNGMINGLQFVAHQVGQLLRSASDKIAEIIYHKRVLEKRDFSEITADDIANVGQIVEKIRLLSFLINQCQKQNLRNRRIQDIAADRLKIERTAIPDFWRYLRNKCLDLDAFAKMEKGIHVWLQNSEEKNVKVETDEGLLSELIYNLLDNAVKYSFEAKEMRSKGVQFDNLNYKSDGNILVKYSVSYSDIILEITNWGIPIPKNEKNSIFRLFYRGSNATHISGSGMGLFLVKKITEAMKGTVEVISQPSKNMTTFKIVINR